jgi:hypothetical protein
MSPAMSPVLVLNVQPLTATLFPPSALTVAEPFARFENW